MDYFKILNLNKEPFSNSPDPDNFFHSNQHRACLQKLEISLRLRRGLNVVIGDIGTGKTTLCRQIIRMFAVNNEIETHLILDPFFTNSTEFLMTFAKMLKMDSSSVSTNDWELKEYIKQYLFKRGVDEKKIVTLIIDEGQKLSDFIIEVLREFLNYETNEFKLLQILIFAQKEFVNTLKKYANFTDRISLYHELKPLNFKDTRLMIEYRLSQAVDEGKNISYFSYFAQWAIYRAAKGHPRRIINLCHQCLLAMIVQNSSMVDFLLVKACIKRSINYEERRFIGKKIIVTLTLILLAILIKDGLSEKILFYNNIKINEIFNINFSKNKNLPDKSLLIKTEKKDSIANVQENKKITETVKTEKAILNSSNLNLKKDKDNEKKDNNSKNIVTDNKNSQNPISYDRKLFTILGTLKVKQGETLGELVKMIYGETNEQLLKAIRLTNPKISLKNIKIDSKINFPAIPVIVKPISKIAYWIEIDNKNRLDEALEKLKDYVSYSPEIRLIPYWNSPEGLKFSIVLKEYFLDKGFAQNKFNEISSSLFPNKKIISLWNEEFSYFVDPFYYQENLKTALLRESRN